MASNHIVICRNLSFFHFSNKLIAAINCFDVNLLMAAFHLFRFPPGNINCKLLLHISIRWSSTKSLSSFAWELVQLLPFTYSSDRTLTNKLFAQAFNCISSNLNSRDSLPADGKVPRCHRRQIPCLFKSFQLSLSPRYFTTSTSRPRQPIKQFRSVLARIFGSLLALRLAGGSSIWGRLANWRFCLTFRWSCRLFG